MQQQGVNVDMDSMSNSWTVSSFDEAVTLKTLGYPAPHYYYR
jgi:predicted alpha/beta-fold hydrolase